MFSAFKIVAPCLAAFGLYLVSGCQPNLDSLSASYDSTAGRTDGTGGQINGSGGDDTSGSGDDTSAGASAIPAACKNKKRDSNESDTDCGGTSVCARCDSGLRCTNSKDCDSGYCDGAHCAEPTCADNVKNQDETGIDCGGSCSPAKACDDGLTCDVNADCSSGFCQPDGFCGDHCGSGKRDGDETDKDCGGSCDPCADKLHCSTSSDCLSKICFNNICQAATCGDGVQNQDETDKDCGGSCAAMSPCPNTAKCKVASDCDSYVCTSSKCVADIKVDPADLIDDFEDLDVLLPVPAADHGNRNGTWYTFGDMGGLNTRENVAIDRGKSARGLHTTGKDFNDWGSGIGADLDHPDSLGQKKNPWNASAYSGVTFWARAGKKGSINLAVSNKDTDADAIGKTCMNVCNHQWYRTVSVTTDWQRFTVAFSSLSLEPGNDPANPVFDSSSIVSVQFREPLLPSGESYDLWIDDVAFVK